MKAKTWQQTNGCRMVVAAVLATIMLTVSACSSTPIRDNAQTVWGDDLNRVQIQPASPGANTAGAIDIRPSQLRRVLSQLRYRDQAGDTQHVFTAKTLTRIAEPLSAGLGRLQAGEDLIFSVTQKNASNGRIISVFSDATLTTGRMFVADGRLNVIFGRMHAAFEDAYTATGVGPRQTPGRRSKRVDSGWTVLETRYVDHKSKARGDWIVIAPAAWETATATTTTTQAPEETAVKPATNPATDTAPTTTTNPYYRRTHARLKAIKRLRDDGLLSDAEYRDMRTRILERLVESNE